MLKHVVLLSLSDPQNRPGLSRAMASLESLVDRIEGMLDISHGPNLDFEAKSAAYHYGFVVNFADRDAHLAYERHPEHKAAGAQLVAMCRGGADGIFVADLSV